MSRNRKNKKPPQAVENINAPSAAWGGGYGGVGSGYSAGDESRDRGYVVWPSNESKYALTPYVRKEVYKRANWLVSNNGIARSLANTIPQLAGPLTPQPTTKDDVWNALALEYFNRTQGSRLIHDQGGMENFYTRQRTILKQGLVNGDCFIILTKTTTGNARTILYESGQVGNGASQKQNDGWFDGVRVDKFGKKVAYAFLKPGVQYSTETEVVPAYSVLHCGRFETPSSPRGLTGFIHAINHLLDIREIDNDTKRGIKASNLVGLVVTNQALGNIDAAPAAGKYATRPDYRALAAGTPASPKPLKYEEITEGGGAMMTLNAGQDMKVVHDGRPHPNQQAKIDYFIHDIAAGFKMPYEVMWNIQGISGPAVRFIMRMAEKTLNSMRDELKEQFCQPYWNYTIALAIKNGALPVPNDPDWWKCEWIAPSAMTIDAGRDSASGMKELETGGTTYHDWYAEDGLDWRKQFRKRGVEAAEAMKIEKELGLDRGTVIKMPELPPPPPVAGPPPLPNPPKPTK